MTDEIVARVARSTRYRDVDRAMVVRLAREEAARGGSVDVVAKRVKRRLHQVVGAFRGTAASDADRLLAPIRAAWRGNMADPAFRSACRSVLGTHASTRERVEYLDRFFTPIWGLTGGAPQRLLDLGCGVGPLMLPWMGLAGDATYVAVDADHRALSIVGGFLDLVGQPHEIVAADLATVAPEREADVALLLKLVPTLERQGTSAVPALLSRLQVNHAVLSFPARSLGRRAKGMERTYRSFVARLSRELGLQIAEASIGDELVFVLRMDRG